MFKYKSASFVLMCGHMLVFIICIGCWFVYVTLVLLYMTAVTRFPVSLLIHLGIFEFCFFFRGVVRSVRRTVFTVFFFHSIIHHPTTHFHQSCCQWNSVAPLFHQNGSQYFRLKLLLPWSQHLDCCHTRSRGSQQQLSFP